MSAVRHAVPLLIASTLLAACAANVPPPKTQLQVREFQTQTFDTADSQLVLKAMFNALQDIDRLSQIVRALLLLSQAESGQLVLQKSRLDLRQVLEDLAEQFQIPAEAAGLHLTADLPPQCLVEGDRVQIERMITNLLSNAIKFTPEGGDVRLTAANRDRRVEIVVEDSGRGIATEHLPYIFDRFYRVPGSGGAPGPEQGLGLGLSFVAWIVKAHRGVIDVQTVLGAISIYVTIGLVAAFLYASIADLSSSQFFVQQSHATTADFVYYSYVTLTTTGYGDLTAAGNIGRSVSILEAMLGQLYLVTVVAVVIGRLGRRSARSSDA